MTCTTTSSTCATLLKTDDPCVTLINGVPFRHEEKAKIIACSHRYAKVNDKSYRLVDGKWEEMPGKDAVEAAREDGNNAFSANDGVTASELFALFTKPKQEKPVFLRPYAPRNN